MDRVWLLTWTTYGTWLPGDDRGFVSNVADATGRGHRLNRPGTEPATKQRGLTLMAQDQLLGPPIWLTPEQAPILLEQFRETANHRGWSIVAVAIMANHVHIVLGVTDDPEPETLLRDLKSYGSRSLNRRYGKPRGGTWWTEGGSRRKLADESSVFAATAYVENQESPLLVWADPEWANGGRRPTVPHSPPDEATRCPNETGG
jgi:REP element-mobilizing transposase RayT